MEENAVGVLEKLPMYLAQIPGILEQLAFWVGSLALVATLVAKVTPTPKDDKVVSKVSEFILKVLRYLPTLGINPKTKQLEKAYEELKK